MEYPPRLDLSAVVAGPQAAAAGTSYALCGVVKHTGKRKRKGERGRERGEGRERKRKWWVGQKFQARVCGGGE